MINIIYKYQIFVWWGYLIISYPLLTRMGNSSEKPPLPSSLTPITDARYGGNIYLDSTKTKAYQILDIDQSSR